MKNKLIGTPGDPRFKRLHAGRFVSSFLLFIVCQVTLIALGYLVVSNIFAAANIQGELLIDITSALIGTILMCIAILIFTHTKGAAGQQNYFSFGQDILEALERISQGDFDIEVTTDTHNPLNDLADSVNKMARELGTLEQQRQEFISNVSHEIQSPLTSIHGFATLLKNPNLSEPDRLHYLEIIETESQRLSKLSDSLLRLSVLDGEATTSPQTYRLDQQVQSVALMLEPQWSAKQILLEVDAEQIQIHADEDLLNQVWINLIQNAIKFTPEGGNIKVALEQRDVSIVCQIQDTGIGIAPEDQPHIFERFYRADKARQRSQGGNGLGLAVVKRIVELHGGTITVHSHLNQGTIFTIVIPK